MRRALYLSPVLMVALICQPSSAALNAYLRLRGEFQGEIKGDVTQAGREDSILVIATNHQVVTRRDAASGLPSGQRHHEPFRLTKEIDRSTPLLMKALIDNERLTELEIRYWRPSATGKEVQFYTVFLHNARIIAIQQEMLNNRYPENADHKEREHVSFVYQRIQWTYEDGGLTAEDPWQFSPAPILISDLNGDGIVDLLDLALFAHEWLTRK
jgi:type VI secretion system secreted protein Hcp